jgi:hypothetical protein
MQNQFFSTIFEDKFNGGHYLVVSAAVSAQQALADAQQHLEQHREVQTSALGTFAGILQPALPHLPQGHAMERVLTKSARQLDLEQAKAEMLDWTSLGYCGTSYAAVVSPPEELDNLASPETLTISFEDGNWWLDDPRGRGQGEFLFLTDAVKEGNKCIEAINADFQKDLTEAVI